LFASLLACCLVFIAVTAYGQDQPSGASILVADQAAGAASVADDTRVNSPEPQTSISPHPSPATFSELLRQSDPFDRGLSTAAGRATVSLAQVPLPETVRPGTPLPVIPLIPEKTPPISPPPAEGAAPAQPQPTPFGVEQFRLPTLGIPPGLGTPKPTPEEEQKFKKFVQSEAAPENTFQVVLGRAKVLVFRQAPRRVYIPREDVAEYQVITPRQLAVVGKKVGSTVLNLWFPSADHAEDPSQDVLLSYLVMVLPDPELALLDRKRLESEVKAFEAAIRALETEINTAFPDSAVRLALVGDQVVVRGEAKDAIQAAQILHIVALHAPTARRTQVNAGRTQSNAGALNINFIPGLGDETAAVAAIRALLEGNPNIVNLLNIPGEQQVMLMVTVAEVNRTAARSIGVNFTIAKGGFQFGQLTGGLITPASIASNAMGAAGGGISSLGGNLPTSIDNGSVLLAIQALRTLNFARTLAEPNLTTLNGRAASFRAGGEFPVPNSVVTPGGAAQSVTYLPFGVQLQFIPYITDRDRVRLEVHAAVSTRSAATTEVSGASVPSELDERTFTTTVDLRDGQTLTVAGLINTSFGATSNRVPFFGDLPVIGRLFGSDQVTSSEQELMILVTPVLVHPLERCKTPALPGSDLFEPGDIEFFLGGHLEGHRTEDYRSCVRTDYARQAAYCNCENLYIIGPKGPTYGCCSGQCCASTCPASAAAPTGAAAGANTATAVGQRDAKTAAADGTEETKTR
jgi:pilus assembly protein CpaC